MPISRAERISGAASRAGRPLRYLFLEAILIAIGVALALFAQKWQEDRQQREVVRTALASIHEELRQNRDLVVAAQEYHGEKMAMLRASFGPEGKQPTPGDFPGGFIAPAQLFDVAWQTALETDALHELPYEQILEIAQIYATQESYRLQSERSGELIFADLYQVGAQGIVEKRQSLMSLIGAFLYRERALLEAFEEALPKIEGMEIRG